MEITNPNRHKSYTLCKWKQLGLIYHNLEELYQTYINTTECGHCGKVFENTYDRCMDHCHETGLFRKIVCRRCNTCDRYIKYPDGVPSLGERYKEYQKEYLVVNRDKIKEYRKEYRLVNKEKIKEKNKEYQVVNRDKIKEKRQKDRDKINERRRELRKEKKQLLINSI